MGIVSFVVDGWNARDAALTLSGEYGIGVQDGKFCAHPFVRHLLDADGAAGMHRRPGLRGKRRLRDGTAEEHVDPLLDALARLAYERRG